MLFKMNLINSCKCTILDRFLGERRKVVGNLLQQKQHLSNGAIRAISPYCPVILHKMART